MKKIWAFILIIITLPIVALADSLPSWNDSKLKNQIMAFVTEVSNTNSPKYVQPEDRIAVFDNDGTLWSEQPIYFQFIFAIDYVQKNYPNKPEWADNKAAKTVYEQGLGALAQLSEEELYDIVFLSHTNMSVDDFNANVQEWIASATHPVTGKLYTQMIFQPMLELIDYLKQNDFNVYIVSGGGENFIRVWAPQTYGIAAENIVGTELETKYEVIDGKPTLMRLPKLTFLDDKEGKPVGILNHIGKQPILAVGNSDGDFQMLEWTTDNENNLGILLHHTDAEREFAYDKESAAGKLDKGLAVNKPNWLIIDMKNDWKIVYPE